MAKSTTGLPNLPPEIDEAPKPSSLFPGFLSSESPSLNRKPRKKSRKVTNIEDDVISAVAVKIRNLLKQSARSFRTDEVKKEVSGILPALIQQNDSITDQELNALRNMVHFGDALVKLSKEVKTNRILSEMLISIGEALQGI